MKIRFSKTGDIVGLFDGKIIELGNKLSTNLDSRASEMEDELSQVSIKDPGRTFTLKMAIFVFSELSVIIQKTIKD